MWHAYLVSRFPSSAERVEEAEVLVFGVPFDATVDFLPGTRFGPRIIREAANFIEPFDVELQKNVLEEVKIFDLGDLEPCRGRAEETVKRVEEQVKEFIKLKKMPLMLGGEHLISLGAVRAFGKEIKVVCFDAHYDLKEVWEGSEYAHNTWLRRAAEVVGERNICLIGVRTGDEFEFEYSKKMLVNPSIEELANFAKDSKVYLTIDMDVFDPAYAPGVGTPEPFGMVPSYALPLIELIAKVGKIAGMDVVEVRPLEDRKTEILAARLIFKALLYIKG